MLEVKALSRQYGSFTAVDNVSFSINKGEIVGLLGHNGAGKTTIMKMISGYLEPNQGTVELDGISLQEQPKAMQKCMADYQAAKGLVVEKVLEDQKKSE